MNVCYSLWLVTEGDVLKRVGNHHLAQKNARVFVRGRYPFREHSSRKTVCFEEQIMTKDIFT